MLIGGDSSVERSEMPDLSLLPNLQKVCSCSHEKQEPPKKLSQNQSVPLIFELRKPKPLDFRLRGNDGSLTIQYAIALPTDRTHYTSAAHLR